MATAFGVLFFGGRVSFLSLVVLFRFVLTFTKSKQYADLHFAMNDATWGEFNGRSTFNFDMTSQVWSSSWIDTMATGLYIQTGKHVSNSDGSTTITLASDVYTDPMTRKQATARSTYVVSKEKIEYDSWKTIEGEDEQKSMRIVYRRL